MPSPPEMATTPTSSKPASQRQRLTVFSGAISTAASPLQGSFALSCRSPIRPSHDGGYRNSHGTPTESRRGLKGSPFLAPAPSSFPLLSPRLASSKLIYEGGTPGDGYYDGDDSTDSPTDEAWLLPQPSPGLLPGGLAQDSGKLGVLSAINIIVGKTVGAGAYSVPSAIFEGVGSVGMSLLVWAIGALISFCGLAVYLDLGTAIPRSGGERVYLERIFRRPYMLATCMFGGYVVLLGFSTPNAIVLGEYVLYSLDVAPNRWNVRAIAVAAVSLLCYMHARHPKLGLRLINVFGVAKLLILVLVILLGVVAGLAGVGSNHSLLRHRRLDADMTGADMALSTAKRNFTDIWAGSSSQPYDYATALLKVIYCFRGYSTANQVLSDVKNPVHTLKVAAPIALTLVSLAYLAINVAFFLVVDKDDFKSAGVVVAGIFFRNVFGSGSGGHILPLCIIISAAGNIAATSFAQARVNEELAKDGLLPWSSFWSSAQPAAPDAYASSSPTKRRGSLASPGATLQSPSRGLLLHWLVSVLVIVLPPPGPLYNFLVDIGGYPVSVISAAVALGLLYLKWTPSEGWHSPCPAPTVAVVLFAVGNVLLLLLPWIPPVGGRGEDAGVVYYAYPATALAVLGVGAVWWLWWRRGPGNRGGERTEWEVSSAAMGLLTREDEDEDRGGAGEDPAGLRMRTTCKCGCPLST